MDIYMAQEQDTWEFLKNEQINQLPKISSYGRKYKQYLNNSCPIFIIDQIRNQLFFSQELINIVELICEVDIHNQLITIGQQSDFSQRAKHLYNKQYCHLHLFRQSKNCLSSFIFWLNELITKSYIIKNCDKRASRLLSFKLALDIYIKYFLTKGMLH